MASDSDSDMANASFPLQPHSLPWPIWDDYLRGVRHPLSQEACSIESLRLLDKFVKLEMLPDLGNVIFVMLEVCSGITLVCRDTSLLILALESYEVPVFFDYALGTIERFTWCETHITDSLKLIKSELLLGSGITRDIYRAKVLQPYLTGLIKGQFAALPRSRVIGSSTLMTMAIQHLYQLATLNMVTSIPQLLVTLCEVRAGIEAPNGRRKSPLLEALHEHALYTRRPFLVFEHGDPRKCTLDVDTFVANAKLLGDDFVLLPGLDVKSYIGRVVPYLEAMVAGTYASIVAKCD